MKKLPNSIHRLTQPFRTLIQLLRTLMLTVNFQALVVILFILFLMLFCLPQLVAAVLFIALMGALHELLLLLLSWIHPHCRLR